MCVCLQRGNFKSRNNYSRCISLTCFYITTLWYSLSLMLMPYTEYSFVWSHESWCAVRCTRVHTLSSKLPLVVSDKRIPFQEMKIKWTLICMAFSMPDSDAVQFCLNFAFTNPCRNLFSLIICSAKLEYISQANDQWGRLLFFLLLLSVKCKTSSSDNNDG